jgi:plastocyanin
MKRILAVAALAVTASVASAQGVATKLSEFKIELAKDTVKAGRVSFQITNIGSTSHQLRIEGNGFKKETAVIPARQAAVLTVTLAPGTYDVFCPMSEDSHKMAGMAKKLVVTGPAPAATKKP